MEAFFLPFAAANGLYFVKTLERTKAESAKRRMNKIIGAIRIIRENGARDKLSITILTDVYVGTFIEKS